MVVGIARAEVEHLSKCAMGDNRGDICIRGEYTAAAIHTEQAGMVARVDSRSPVLVDARCTVAMCARGASPKSSRTDVLAADITEDWGRGWEGHRRRRVHGGGCMRVSGGRSANLSDGNLGTHACSFSLK